MSSSDPVPFRRLRRLRILPVRHSGLLPMERHAIPVQISGKLRALDGDAPGLVGGPRDALSSGTANAR